MSDYTTSFAGLPDATARTRRLRTECMLKPEVLGARTDNHDTVWCTRIVWKVLTGT